MILVDTSIWIEHLRRGLPALAAVLEQEAALMHPFVVGELACGNLKNRVEVLRLLRDLPMAPIASDGEVLALIEIEALMGRGIGYIDAHLLAAARLAGNVPLWTHDQRLASVAAAMKLSYRERA
jgi:predicted nucleic acid-binding protein